MLFGSIALTQKILKPDIACAPAQRTVVSDFIKPIFSDLSDDNLLKRCLHGKTQNSNEALNGLIWKRCPKDIFVGRETIEIGVESAVISYNGGATGLVDVFKNVNKDPGTQTIAFCNGEDINRVFRMERKETKEVKNQRKRKRAERKGYTDANEQKEGLTYGSGLF